MRNVEQRIRAFRMAAKIDELEEMMKESVETYYQVSKQLAVFKE